MNGQLDITPMHVLNQYIKLLHNLQNVNFSNIQKHFSLSECGHKQCARDCATAVHDISLAR